VAHPCATHQSRAEREGTPNNNEYSVPHIFL